MGTLRKRLTYANVMATLAVFVAVSVGTAWALERNSVGSKHVKNFSLNDQDVGSFKRVALDAFIGTVPPNSCEYRSVTGIPVGGDHLLLTPSNNDSSPHIVYHAQYEEPGSDALTVAACNISNAEVVEANTDLNLLVFDAQ